MAGIVSPTVCELVSCRKEKDEAAQSFTETKNVLLRRQAQLEGVIRYWEFSYGRLDRYTHDLAVRNRNWEKNQNLMQTRINQRDAVIKGLTEANQSLVQRCTGFENPSWSELIHQKDTEIVGLKNERDSLSQTLAVSTNWQEKYNALERSSKILEEKKLCPETKMATHFERVEKDEKSLANRIRKDTAERRESWASLSKLIKEKIQKLEDKKTHQEEKPTKDLAEKPYTRETAMEKEIQNLDCELKKPEDDSTPALFETHQSEVEEVILMETTEENLMEKNHLEEESAQALFETPKVEDEMKTPEEESTKALVETPKVEDEMKTPEEESTKAQVETPKVEDEMKTPEEESTKAQVETPKVEDEIKTPEEESTKALVETPKVEDEIKTPEEESTKALVETPKVEDEMRTPEEESTKAQVETPKVEDEMRTPEEESTKAQIETPKVEDEMRTPEEESTKAQIETPKVEDEIKTPEEESTKALVETKMVEDEKKEPEEFFILKKTKEVVLQKEKSRKNKKQNKKKDNTREQKFPEVKAEKHRSFETVWGTVLHMDDELMKPDEESTKETPNCWEMKFTEMWTKVKQTKDNLAKKDQICETKEVDDEENATEEFPALTTTNTAEIGLQKMESGDEEKLSWAAVLANKDRSSKTKDKKVEGEKKDPEEASDLKKDPEEASDLKKDPEEVSDLKQDSEEVSDLKQDPEEVSDLKQDSEEVSDQKQDPEEVSDLKQDSEEASDLKQIALKGKVQRKKSRKEKKQEKKADKYNRGRC
ncbi:hypothetical protein PBY51_019810 [Eleginops maclovinus]|uniref:Uncharacterized protein n=1 Tax=Eleginops maclovinus TaxID=56733 RepID=A0AAN7XRP8_ELEMC|nr:hypothetical protein PBY51_019810 [Eleginops maclovinus]